MVKFVDNRIREDEILDLVVESYIEKTKPISSDYLCDRYNLPYSSATVRSVMLNLENKGYLCHIYTSSGRIPTKAGFKSYVGHLKEEDIIKVCPANMENILSPDDNNEKIINDFLGALSEISGYTSLFTWYDEDGEEKLFFKGARFIVEQPEFGNVQKLRNLFYVLEVKIEKLKTLLLKCADDKIKILVGDDIGCEEIDECSLVISGTKEDDIYFALGLIGPMRMDYLKASACISSIKDKLKVTLKERI